MSLKNIRDSLPSTHIEDFLNFVKLCSDEFAYASDIVANEDKQVQDFLHAIEFAEDKGSRNRLATKLQQSRRTRRESKDVVLYTEKIVNFFQDQNNRATLNRLSQLLGQQRKEEDFLQGTRSYLPRVKSNSAIITVAESVSNKNGSNNRSETKKTTTTDKSKQTDKVNSTASKSKTRNSKRR